MNTTLYKEVLRDSTIAFNKYGNKYFTSILSTEQKEIFVVVSDRSGELKTLQFIGSKKEDAADKFVEVFENRAQIYDKYYFQVIIDRLRDYEYGEECTLELMTNSLDFSFQEVMNMVDELGIEVDIKYNEKFGIPEHGYITINLFLGIINIGQFVGQRQMDLFQYLSPSGK